MESPLTRSARCAAASSLLSQLLSGVMDADKASIKEARDTILLMVSTADVGQLAKLLVSVRAIFDEEGKHDGKS